MNIQENKQQQIAAALRQRIFQGDYPPGSKLPTYRQLSEEFHSSIGNIHHALNSLCVEGLIARQRSLGVRVQTRAAELRQVVILACAHKPLGLSVFCRSLVSAIDSELHRHHCDTVILIEDKDHMDYSRLDEMVHSGRIQGLIMVNGLPDIMARLKRYHLPTAAFGAINDPCTIGYNQKQCADVVIDEFVRLGCKRIGYISSVSFAARDEVDRISDSQDAFEYFKEKSAQAGLEFRKEWFLEADFDMIRQERYDTESYDLLGYHSFQKLWAQKERPDGLLVISDDVTNGVLLAILGAGIMVPQELQLIFHRNIEMKRICPIPCSFVNTSVNEIARAHYHLLCAQMQGEKVSPRLLDHTISTQQQPLMQE